MKKSKFRAFLKEYKLLLFLIVLFLMILAGIGWYFLNMYNISEDKNIKYEIYDSVSDEPMEENPTDEVEMIYKEQERERVDEISSQAYNAIQEGNENQEANESSDASTTKEPTATPEPTESPKPKATKKPKQKLTKGQKAFLKRERARKKSRK